MSVVNKITEYFHKKNNLRQAVVILFVTVLISNVLGLIRNMVMANRVGVTYGSIGPLDSYYAAFAMPDLLYSIVIVGALSSAVLPLLVDFEARDDQEGFWKTFNVLLSTGFVLIALIMGLLYLFLPYFIPMFLPGFSHADQNLTIELSRILVLSPLLFTMSQITSSALQARKIFFAPAVAPIVYNISIIISALFIPSFGLKVLPLGIVLGALGHFLVQLPSLLKEGWKFKFQLDPKNEHLRKVMKLMIPRMIALTSTQLLLIAFYQLASSMSRGSIAIYRLSDDLETAPVLLLANTLAMAVFPDFSRHIANNEHGKFEELVGQASRFLIFAFLPVSLYLFIFRSEIIGLYISIGHSISPKEVSIAARTFGYFVSTLLFQGAVLVLARAYFARGNTKTPTLISVSSIIIAYLFAVLVVKVFGFGVDGLALAFSIGSLINATLLWSFLKLPLRVLVSDINKKDNFMPIVVASLASLLVMLVMRSLLENTSITIIKPSLTSAIKLLIAFGVGGGVYWQIAKLFKLEQWQLITKQTESTTK